MKRCCLLVALLLFVPFAHAGEGISFSIGGHRIHLGSARCRAPSCVQVSGAARRDDGGDNGRTLKPVPAPAAPPAIPAATSASTAPAVVPAAPPAPPPRVMTVQPPPVAAPPSPPAAVPARPAPPAMHAAREADEPDDGPIGDWQTETDSLVRVRLCGNALCGYALDRTTRDLGEAVLINMKPNKDARWSGSVYSQDSGKVRYGAIELRGANQMRVEACALGRFYCRGADWIRVSRSRPRAITQGPPQTRPRS
ncbi:DUF2147 domain-containing protein [Bradyrhizobium sp. Ce-3]|uniref:DUF2147 domain-containing protein n=1 Tax=Bradyrhizobium sp. Ce-3 TaxID=2913970 RepID=UPI001FC8BCAA|nr:DUF2147 domain-containing protein [Bradyrhizobium sp. Ce-3]GKQ54829.1 hypothetical protein BRSPCE3_56840 [Bradyrhizobium sp. Ce-3]